MVNLVSSAKAEAAHRKALYTNINYTRIKVSVVNAEYDRNIDDIKINTPANQDYKIKNDRN